MEKIINFLWFHFMKIVVWNFYFYWHKTVLKYQNLSKWNLIHLASLSLIKYLSVPYGFHVIVMCFLVFFCSIFCNFFLEWMLLPEMWKTKCYLWKSTLHWLLEIFQLLLVWGSQVFVGSSKFTKTISITLKHKCLNLWKCLKMERYF